MKAENKQHSNDSFKERLKDQVKDLIDIINQSNGQFEKQLSYISGGALALSFIVIEKVLKDFSKTQHKWILIAGWALLTITLLLNLFSHKKAIDNHSKSLSETNDFINNRSNVYDYEKIERRNKQIQRINTFTLYSLSFGLISLIVYTSINFYISD